MVEKNSPVQSYLQSDFWVKYNKDKYMCGIFGVIGETCSLNEVKNLAKYSERRGRDSSGLVLRDQEKIRILKSDEKIASLLKGNDLSGNYNLIFGHTRLITNGLSDNQPIMYPEAIVVHNGIIVNYKEIFELYQCSPKFQIDTEAINMLIMLGLEQGKNLSTIAQDLLDNICGTLSICVLLPTINKVLLLSNNGSLYTSYREDNLYFASEYSALHKIGCKTIKQLNNEYIVCNLTEQVNELKTELKESKRDRLTLIPEVSYAKLRDKLLVEVPENLKRCNRCILPETMPFIKFNDEGMCNYCENYESRLNVKEKSKLLDIVEPFRRGGKRDVILPFSGGRDSCYGLHIAVNELGMKPITYTYDWGMVTDLARRNISRMCSKLGVENIIVAADIQKKRANIRKNLLAWLKSPDLGMVSILTAGDKHFFRYVKDIQTETGITLNLWGVNPLEITHFKAGFLGIPPSFEETKVYNNGYRKQLRYQLLRFKAMLRSPGYFNSSIFDTLSGEYYRSIASKKDYHHIFDYWTWNEELIDSTLINEYDWELSPDTPTTWRIGDGTAGFYNYIYTTVAGFSEHDTFRSNQVREGIITRDQALEYVSRENEPRYPNIKWYLDTLGLEYNEVIQRVNSIPKLYHV